MKRIQETGAPGLVLFAPGDPFVSFARKRLYFDSKAGIVHGMNKKDILNLIDAIPDDLNFVDIVEQLTKQPGVSQTTLGNFVHSSKSAIGRIKEGQEPKFQTGLGLLRMFVTLCPDNNDDDEKGKDNA